MFAFIISLRMVYDIQVLFEDSKRDKEENRHMTEKKTVITNCLYAAVQLTRMWPRSAKLKRASVETSFK